MKSESSLPHYPPLLFVRITESVRSGLKKLSRRFTHPNVIMMEHLKSIWVLSSLSVVSELGIADILKSGPKSIQEIADMTGTFYDPLYRIMRLLASEGIFFELKGQRFRNNELSLTLTSGELRHFVRHTLNSMQFRIFGEMIHTARTGRRTSELFIEGGVFEHMGKNKELNELYNLAMTNTSRLQVAAILSSYNFNKHNHIVDIAGGRGFLLFSILERNISVKGTLFDLPQVVEVSGLDPAAERVADRLEVKAGSFFDEIPPGGDLYILKNIIHGWSDEDSVRILSNIRKAIPGSGKIMIVEAIVGKRNKPSWGTLTDIFMMAGLGGRERTLEEYNSILERSGFRTLKVKKTVSPLSLIFAIPVNI